MKLTMRVISLALVMLLALPFLGTGASAESSETEVSGILQSLSGIDRLEQRC